MKIRKLVIGIFAVILCIGNFWALDPKQELRISTTQATWQYKGSESAYQLIKKNKDDFPIEVLEEYFFQYGALTDYIDTMKADGILPQNYQYGGSTATTAPAPTPEPAAPAHEHTYKEEVTKESTCKEEGTLTKTCECGYVVTEKLPLGEHEYFEQVGKEVSCTVDGEVSYLCSVCGDTYTETVAATGHITGPMEVITEASCTTDGESGIKCKTCGEFIDKTTVPATGHTEGNWEVTKKSGFMANGEQVKKCTVCGEVLATEAIPYDMTAVIIAVVAVIAVAGVIIYKKTCKSGKC